MSGKYSFSFPAIESPSEVYMLSFGTEHGKEQNEHRFPSLVKISILIVEDGYSQMTVSPFASFICHSLAGTIKFAVALLSNSFLEVEIGFADSSLYPAS